MALSTKNAARDAVQALWYDALHIPSLSKLTELKGVKSEPANNMGRWYLENCVRAATRDLRFISEGKRLRPLRKTAHDVPA